MELGKGDETRYVFIAIDSFQITQSKLGVLLHRKLKDAIINHARQWSQFEELLDACSESSSKKIEEWDLAIQEWENDHSKPDPYDESEYGKQSI